MPAGLLNPDPESYIWLMKPLRIFIFFLTVTLLLLCLALIFPKEGIRISPGIRLQFASLSDLNNADSLSVSQHVDSLLALSTVTEDPESIADTFAVRIDPANTDSLKKALSPIQFPEEGRNVLIPFFSELESLSKGEQEQVRIMHFGDSQIEQDRMTALIRYRLQSQFGGSGCGLVHAVPLYSGHMAYTQEMEGDWLRYTFFGKRDSSIRHRAYGVMASFSSVPRVKDGSWPALHYRFNTSRRTGRVDRIRVFLHAYTGDGSVALVVNDSIRDTILHLPMGFNLVEFRHNEPIINCSLSMGLPEGGRIYGISFESQLGLQMDNIAMRGSAGLLFSKINREQQMRMMELLSPGLLILQYGGNVVPYINAPFYQKAFTRELKVIKDLCPGVPVIVIGPSDMSFKEKGRFVSFPGVEPVRDALKGAALDNGCAFWDLYEAMGGKNSMPSFVHSDPPLASTDYVHFTSLGVNLVAEMFHKALMMEYALFLEGNTNNSKRE